jgi:hypothetical protein
MAVMMPIVIAIVIKEIKTENTNLFTREMELFA